MVADLFPIHQIEIDAPEDSEAMGTKRKFWYGNRRWLFKYARPHSGEDWSEKIAAELGSLLQIPHAHYELAEFNGSPGSISESFLTRDRHLIHGNELLYSTMDDYPEPSETRKRRQSHHTLEAVLQTIGSGDISPHPEWEIPHGIESAVGVFAGYLLFDAWIGNTDRHDENWGCLEVRSEEGTVKRYLAPAYDQASCLGRELTDQERSERLHTRDANRTVRMYAEKTRSALYGDRRDTKPLSPLAAFTEIARQHSQAAEIWLQKLRATSAEQVHSLVARIPESRISPIAARLAEKVLQINRERLLSLNT